MVNNRYDAGGLRVNIFCGSQITLGATPRPLQHTFKLQTGVNNTFTDIIDLRNRQSSAYAFYHKLSAAELNATDFKYKLIWESDTVINQATRNSVLDYIFSNAPLIERCEIHGVDIVLSETDSNAYERTNGTSLASPIVAGAAGLILSRKPDITTAQLKDIILSSAATPTVSSGVTSVAGSDGRAGTSDDLIANGRVLSVENIAKEFVRRYSSLAPKARTISVTSSNTENNRLAVTGDTVTITVVANENVNFIDKPIVRISPSNSSSSKQNELLSTEITANSNNPSSTTPSRTATFTFTVTSDMASGTIGIISGGHSTVSGTPFYINPVVILNAPTRAFQNEQVTFNIETADTVNALTINYGDGSSTATLTGSTATHTYSTPNTYTVTVTATNVVSGTTTTHQLQRSLQITNKPPTITISNIGTTRAQTKNVTVALTDTDTSQTLTASYKIQSGSTCSSTVDFTSGATAITLSSNSGTITLNQESQNGQYICVRAYDTVGYSYSAAQIQGIDRTAPTITGVAVVSNNATNTLARAGNVLTFTITANEALAAASAQPSTLSATIGGTNISIARGTVSGSTVTYTYTVQASQNGAVGINFNGLVDTVSNTQTTAYTTAPTTNVTVDNTVPTATISISPSTVTSGTTTATATITFNESVTGLAQSEVTTTHGTVASLTGSGTTYTATINSIPANTNATGTVTVAANAVQDGAGNNNAQTTQNFTINTVVADTTPPTQ